MDFLSDLEEGATMTRRQRQVSFLLLCSANMMGVMEGSIIQLAIPEIGTAIGTSTFRAMQLISIYLSVSVIGMMSAAALGDRFGHRKLFLIGVPVFILSSLGCSLSSGFMTLLTFRILQAIGSSLMLTNSLALMVAILPKNKMGSAFGIDGLLSALTAIIAPTLGAFIFSHFGWNWLFAINVPLGTFILVLAYFYLPEVKSGKGKLDLFLIICSVGSLTSLSCTINYLTSKEYLFGLVSFLTAIFLAFNFYVHIKKNDPESIPLKLLRNKMFSESTYATGLAYTAQGILMVVFPFLFIHILKNTPFQTALYFGALAAASVISAPISGFLADRINARVICFIGLFLNAVGLLSLNFIYDPQNTSTVLWRPILCGIGFGLFQPAIAKMAMFNIREKEYGIAAGLFKTAKALGLAIGTAVVTVLTGIQTGSNEAQTMGLNSIKAFELPIAIGFGLLIFSTWCLPKRDEIADLKSGNLQVSATTE